MKAPEPEVENEADETPDPASKAKSVFSKTA